MDDHQRVLMSVGSQTRGANPNGEINTCNNKEIERDLTSRWLGKRN